MAVSERYLMVVGICICSLFLMVSRPPLREQKYTELGKKLATIEEQHKRLEESLEQHKQTNEERILSLQLELGRKLQAIPGQQDMTTSVSSGNKVHIKPGTRGSHTAVGDTLLTAAGLVTGTGSDPYHPYALRGADQTITGPAAFRNGPNKVHVFDSGVLIYDHFLRHAQKDRFLKNNLWEITDEPLMIKVLKHGKNGDLFLDCGAALGYYSLLGRRLAPDLEIHAFNPHPKFVARMKADMALNGYDDITIHQMAIADQVLTGVRITSDGFGGRIQTNKVGTTAENTINVTTLNEFGKSLDIAHYDRILLVKADIEGMELRMLQAASSWIGKVQNWIIAIHQTRNECGKFLKEHGYTIIQEEPDRVPGEPNGVLVATLNRKLYFPEFEEDTQDYKAAKGSSNTEKEDE